MAQSHKSWIRNEETRPLCLLRKGLQGIIDSFDPGSAAPEAIRPKLDKLWEDLEEKIPGAFRAERNESSHVLEWLNDKNDKAKPITQSATEDNSQQIRINEPSYQAVWGFGLLINKRLKQPQNEENILKGNKRLISEKNLMGSLLLGTIQNSTTTICWGSSGSWFYHDPRSNHINMDPGQALLLGLQNSRGVLLHEIGHSQITKGRSPKLLAIQKEIENLCPEGPKGLRLVPKNPEDRKKVAKLSREANYRETFWQYAEDACVNTYAEIEGMNFTNDIQTALMRVYAVTLLGREAKQAKEEALKSKTASSNPLKSLQDALKGKGIIDEGSEISKELESRLKAAGAAYPISRGWMDNDSEEDWELIGSKRKDENLQLVSQLSRGIESLAPNNEEVPVAGLQPSLIAKRFEMVSQDSLARITSECAIKRNQYIDEIFDTHFLPLIEKLPDPPELPTSEIEFEMDGTESEDQSKKGKDSKDSKDGKSPKDGKEREQDGSNGKGGQEQNKEGDPGKPQGSEDSKEKKPDYKDILEGKDKPREEVKIENTVEDKTTTLAEASKKNQEDKEREAQEEKRRAKEQQISHGEAIKNSMGQRSPLEDLPTGCGDYQEAAKACQPQIAIVVSILKKIAMRQKVKSPGSRELLPDPLLGAQSFEINSYIERKKKEQSQEVLNMDDRKHFTHEQRKSLKPATTHLAFYIDGSGSMSGRPAEKTMMTLVIFNEASKRVPEIQVSAVYSGAGKTRLLLDAGELCKGEEALIANILKNGYACGDNEISAGGLSEMMTTVAKAVPRHGNFGCTHTIFLTDGGSCPSDKEDIARAITTTLDMNPLSTFDTFVIDGSQNTQFHQSLALVKPKRKTQEPRIKECESVKEICPAIANTLLTRIKEFKSFEPKISTKVKRSFKKLTRELKSQEDGILEHK